MFRCPCCFEVLRIALHEWPWSVCDRCVPTLKKKLCNAGRHLYRVEGIRAYVMGWKKKRATVVLSDGRAYTTSWLSVGVAHDGDGVIYIDKLK